MNKIYLRITVILIVVLLNLSCKKEISCEGCNENKKPLIAIAGPDQVITLPTDSVSLVGSASNDPDGIISEWLWTKVSGPASFIIINPAAAGTSVKNLVSGVYLFELKVKDNKGRQAKDSIRVVVLQGQVACSDCRMVFVSNRDGNNEIYTCLEDGSGIQRLTYDSGSDDEPAWSPDGSRIAFISNRTGKAEIYIMHADGSNITRKTFSAGLNQNPSWSPDGSKIAYSSPGNGSNNIWVLEVASGATSLLFEKAGWEGHPVWSPERIKLALVSDYQAYDFVYDIYTINADGTGFTALTGNIFDHLNYLYPSWSPSGTKLAFAISEEIGIDLYNTRVGVMNPDGSGLTQIRTGAAAWTRTSWSGDGTRIAYTSLSGSRKDISWASADGSTWGTIVTNGWNADWKH